MRVHFGAISSNKIFIKICSHPIISWFFVWPPNFHEKILWPPAFSWPPYSEENDSPLIEKWKINTFETTKQQNGHHDGILAAILEWKTCNWDFFSIENIGLSLFSNTKSKLFIAIGNILFARQI